MWDLPGPGVEPVSRALAGGFFIAVPPGKPPPSPHMSAVSFVLYRLWLMAFHNFQYPLSHSAIMSGSTGVGECCTLAIVQVINVATDFIVCRWEWIWSYSFASWPPAHLLSQARERWLPSYSRGCAAPQTWLGQALASCWTPQVWPGAPMGASHACGAAAEGDTCFPKCPTLCDPTDCGPPGSSVHGILQARILEWVAIPFSRGSSWPRDGTRVSHMQGDYHLSHQGSPKVFPQRWHQWKYTPRLRNTFIRWMWQSRRRKRRTAGIQRGQEVGRAPSRHWAREAELPEGGPRSR